MNTQKIIIGSRGSDLALWQAHYTRDLLQSIGVEVEIKIIKTQGDRIQDLSFNKMEGKGFFTKELEEALLSQEIDLAVHSHKDLPTTQPDGLVIAGVSYREDSSETILMRPEAKDSERPFGIRQGAVIGTSSLRRKSQLENRRTDLDIRDLRGNVPTRVEKLRRGDYDAIILATAGLKRLNLNTDDLVSLTLAPHEFIPAAAQGVLAYQTRLGDIQTVELVQQISRPDIALEIEAERTILNRLEGGCQLPLGVFCQQHGNKLQLWASLQPLDGSSFRRIYTEGTSPAELAEKALHALRRKENRTVYISRNAEDATKFILQTESYGYKVLAFSPIRFETIEVAYLPLTDWVFFCSPRGVMHFFSQELLLPSTAFVGAVGSGTAATLTELGITPHFIGSDVDTRITARQFAEKAKGADILFPCAEGSLRTIQQELESVAKVIDLPVYRTVTAATPVVEAEIFVFTSPSAFNSYCEQHGIPKGRLIAIGHSTLEAIRAKGSEAEIPPFTTIQSLADLVCGI